MGLHGKRDPDAERRRIEKAQANGLGQPGVAGRPKKDSTELIEEKAADRMPYLVDKALDALERGLKSNSEKTALDASAKFFKIFHHPVVRQQMEVSGSVENNMTVRHLLEAQNQLSDADQALLSDFLNVLKDAAEEEAEYIEGELVEPRELTEPPSES